MPSPARHRRHAQPHSHLSGWLAVYAAATPGVAVASNGTVRLDPENEPQPDAMLLIDSACGGQSRTSEDDCIEGAPELIVEIAASSASYDLHPKLGAYRRNGVREYVVLLTTELRLLWFVLREGQYVEQSPDPGGIFRSRIFPGLWLDAPALLAGNLSQVLAVLERGLASPEHAEFVRQLESAWKQQAGT